VKSFNILRYLNFEINRSCNLYHEHEGKCPIAHPERYLFGRKEKALTDDIIVEFWRWCKSKDFRGLVMWHNYNEPTLVLKRIRGIMARIKAFDPGQPFQLTTNTMFPIEGFDIIKRSDYAQGGKDKLDNRIASARGEGKPYAQMPPRGWCARGLGWELDIDNFGNWGLCCNDWRNEESVGNIWVDDWDALHKAFLEKSERIRWNDEASYVALPRMCRSCMDVNPELRTQGGI
jgi:hypothetical protein